MSKIKITFGEINAMIPVMTMIMQNKLPYDISYQLFRIGKTMDEANDYFVKNFREIQESKSDTMQEEITKLATTSVELDSEKLDKAKFFTALKDANVSISPLDILKLSAIVDSEEEPVKGFTIIKED